MIAYLIAVLAVAVVGVIIQMGLKTSKPKEES